MFGSGDVEQLEAIGLNLLFKGERFLNKPLNSAGPSRTLGRTLGPVGEALAGDI